MATIRKEISVKASPDRVWAAVRDVGAVHEQLAPGVVVNTQLENGARVITFANGFVVKETFVTIDDKARRFVYAATGGRATHHNSSVQVFPETGGGSRLVWITDLLPDEMAPLVSGLVEQVSQVMEQTLDVRQQPRAHETDARP